MESTGIVYWLIKPIYGSQRGLSLSSNRYMPPPLSSDVEIMIHRLLSLFHPLPFVHSRFAPQGSTATVRSFNDEFVDIVFRWSEIDYVCWFMWFFVNHFVVCDSCQMIRPGAFKRETKFTWHGHVGFNKITRRGISKEGELSSGNSHSSHACIHT